MIEDAYFGKIEKLGDYYAFSPWLGFFRREDFPHIHHTHLGKMKCAGRGKDDFLFRHAQWGWLWTSPTVFPRFHQRERDRWLLAEFHKDASVTFRDIAAPKR